MNSISDSISDSRRWTVAWRDGEEPVFHRATDWQGTWQEALGMAWQAGEARPDLTIWYLPSRALELDGRVPVEDVLNVLLGEDGKRIPIADDGSLADILGAAIRS